MPDGLPLAALRNPAPPARNGREAVLHINE
jgi:hypothetical protein